MLLTTDAHAIDVDRDIAQVLQQGQFDLRGYAPRSCGRRQYHPGLLNLEIPYTGSGACLHSAWIKSTKQVWQSCDLSPLLLYLG